MRGETEIYVVFFLLNHQVRKSTSKFRHFDTSNSDHNTIYSIVILLSGLPQYLASPRKKLLDLVSSRGPCRQGTIRF